MYIFKVEHQKLLAVISDNNIIFPVLSTFSVQIYPPTRTFSILATKLQSNMILVKVTYSEE